MNKKYRIKEKIIKEYDGTNLEDLLGVGFKSPDRSYAGIDLSNRKFKFDKSDVIASNDEGYHVLHGDILMFSNEYEVKDTNVRVLSSYDTYIEVFNNVIRGIYYNDIDVHCSYEKLPDEVFEDSSHILRELVYKGHELIYAIDTDNGEEFSKNSINERLRAKIGEHWRALTDDHAKEN